MSGNFAPLVFLVFPNHLYYNQLQVVEISVSACLPYAQTNSIGSPTDSEALVESYVLIYLINTLELS
mgnify:CR=1 FL=1